MKCPKCRGKGFEEREHGLIMVFCDCEKGEELRAEITGEMPDVKVGGENEPIILLGEMAEKEGLTCFIDEKGVFHYDSISGDRPDNQLTGSADTGEPKQPKKRKAKKKAGKRAG